MAYVVSFHSILGLRQVGREIASTFGATPMLTGYCVVKCCAGSELWYEPKPNELLRNDERPFR